MKDINILKDDNIGRSLFKLSLPAMIGMLVMSMYNVVDAIFIGKGVGTMGIAAVAISFPIQMIVGAIGQMLGIGGASLLSRSLGAQDYDTSNRILGNVIISTVLFSLVITIIGFLFIDQVLVFFGSSQTILPHAKEYFVYIVPGILFHSMAMALNNLIRAEGKAKVAMFTMIISAVMNIILDALFIFKFKMGISGAAIATLIAYISGAVYLILYYLSGKSILNVKLSYLKFNLRINKEIYAIGIAVFARQAAMSVLVIILNNLLGYLGGDIAIAVYGIVMRILMVMMTPIIGLAQGLQPIAGYNFGAQNYLKTKESVKLAVIVSSLLSISATFVIMVFPVVLLKLFTNDVTLIEQGKTALRFMVLAFPVVGFQIVGSTLYQAIGKAFENLILTLSRQVLFLIPLVFIFSHYFKLVGVWLSFPVADILSFFLTLIFLISLNKQYNHKIKMSEV